MQQRGRFVALLGAADRFDLRLEFELGLLGFPAVCVDSVLVALRLLSLRSIRTSIAYFLSIHLLFGPLGYRARSKILGVFCSRDFLFFLHKG